MKAGEFHTTLPNGSMGVDIIAVIEVLLDVACAIQYLHSLHLVHGDIKVGRGEGAGAGRGEVHEAETGEPGGAALAEGGPGGICGWRGGGMRLQLGRRDGG